MTRNNGVLALTTRRPGSSSASVPVWIRALSDTREKNPEVFSKAQASFWVRFGVMYNTDAGRVTWSLLKPKAVWLDFIGLAGTSTWQPNASRHSGGSTLERGPQGAPEGKLRSCPSWWFALPGGGPRSCHSHAWRFVNHYAGMQVLWLVGIVCKQRP